MARGTKRKLTVGREDPEDDEFPSSSDPGEEDAGISGADQTSKSKGSSSSSSDDSASIDDDEDDGEDSGNEQQTVDVDLEFFDPAEGDFHGLKALLKTYLDANEFKGCSELVEIIIKQVRPQWQQESCMRYSLFWMYFPLLEGHVHACGNEAQINILTLRRGRLGLW